MPRTGYGHLAMRALGPRLSLVQPWGPGMRPLPPARLRRALAEAGVPAVRASGR
ncbi:MAG: hypothetical protein AB1505_17565 [Candidatus Latescibacterota bacterium]